MKFTVNQKQLLSALTICNKAVSQNRIIPILDYFLLEINKDALTITGNNQETCISKIIECQSKEVISICLPASKLLLLVKKLPEQPLIFSITKTEEIIQELPKVVISISIKSEQGVFKMQGEDGIHFSTIRHEFKSKTTVSAEDLNEGIYRTLFCCYSGDDKPSWVGINIDFIKGALRFTALDGFIASTQLLPVANGIEHSVIVTKNSMAIIQGLALKDEVQVSFAKNSICFQQEGLIIISILVDAKFPDFKSILPENKSILTVDRLQLIAAIDRVSDFSYSYITLDVSGESLVIGGDNSDFNESAQEKVKHTFSGESLVIAFLSKQILPCLQKCITDEINIYLSTPKRAILIRESLSDDKENLMLCMPSFIL